MRINRMMSGEAREQAAVILKAAAHPTRLLILETLLRGEKCVCELAPAGVGQAAASKHLSQLKSAGLLKSRKEGLNVYYSIAMPEARLIVGLCKKAVRSRYRAFLKAAGE